MFLLLGFIQNKTIVYELIVEVRSKLLINSYNNFKKNYHYYKKWVKEQAGHPFSFIKLLDYLTFSVIIYLRHKYPIIIILIYFL